MKNKNNSNTEADAGATNALKEMLMNAQKNGETADPKDMINQL